MHGHGSHRLPLVAKRAASAGPRGRVERVAGHARRRRVPIDHLGARRVRLVQQAVQAPAAVGGKYRHRRCGRHRGYCRRRQTAAAAIAPTSSRSARWWSAKTLSSGSGQVTFKRPRFFPLGSARPVFRDAPRPPDSHVGTIWALAPRGCFPLAPRPSETPPPTSKPASLPCSPIPGSTQAMPCTPRTGPWKVGFVCRRESSDSRAGASLCARERFQAPWSTLSYPRPSSFDEPAPCPPTLLPRNPNPNPTPDLTLLHVHSPTMCTKASATPLTLSCACRSTLG